MVSLQGGVHVHISDEMKLLRECHAVTTVAGLGALYSRNRHESERKKSLGSEFASLFTSPKENWFTIRTKQRNVNGLEVYIFSYCGVFPPNTFMNIECNKLVIKKLFI